MVFPAPDLHQPSGLLSPPPSPRKRRRLLRDSEDAEGEMSLGKYIAACDPFRSSSMVDPLPYPVRVKYSERLDHTLRPIMSQIHNVLDFHEFPATTQVETITAWKPGYPGGDREIDLLRVVLDDTNPSPLSFGPAKDDLIRILRHNNHPGIHTDAVVIAFERAKGKIIQALDRAIPQKWHVLCPYSVGRVESKALPAISIVVEAETKADWFALRVEIITLTLPHSNGGPVEVEFSPGSLNFLDSPGESSSGSPGRSFLDRLTPSVVPRMGFSIGIHGQDITGTLGGWVNLTHNGVLHRGFLTNYHVTKPSLSTVYDKGFIEDLNRFGATFDRLPSKPVRMESISKIDRDKTVPDIIDKLETLDARRVEVMTMIEDRQLIGAEPRPGYQTLLRFIDDEINELAAVQGPAESMPHVIGDLVLASGEAMLNMRMMDWAFVRVSEHGRKLFGPNIMFDIPENAQPWKYKSVAPWRPGTIIEEFGFLQDGQFCTKVGRTSGVTSGICHGPRAVCNWHSATRWNENGDAMDLNVYRTEEFMVINKKLTETDFEQSDFTANGDSGSFVLDNNGVVNGLLFAGVRNDHGVVGVVMSMADVLQSIRLKLGGDVSIELPV
ncbi:hypothetical protein N7526_008480 [Penicillium atrosanguineum]|nr:hypothetical protein N7526_008480 [Penicillium atrosanguineum]